eukprot:Ihof_evm11s6 gene=Ihof_evmTU11s6
MTGDKLVLSKKVVHRRIKVIMVGGGPLLYTFSLVAPLVVGALLYALIGHPLSTPVTDGRLDDLDRDSDWIEIRGKRLRVLCRTYSKGSYGSNTAHDGAVVFLLHGAGGQVEQWVEQIEDLDNSKSYKIVACDMVGHGRSVVTTSPSDYQGESLVQDLLTVFQLHKSHKNILIGHSYGCVLATKMYKAISNEINGMVLIGPSIYDSTTQPHVNSVLSLPSLLLDVFRMWDRRGGVDSQSVRRMVDRSASPALKLRQLAWNAHTPSK